MSEAKKDQSYNPPRIIIESAAVHQKDGTSARTGKPYTIREQDAWLDTGDSYPAKISITLGDNDWPFQPGEYIITNPLQPGRFGRLEVPRDLGLVPLASVKPKAG
ncbi:MAG: hypothetical protein KDI75_10030 [Xanthomonadales bacterium]|nr:hypothetical protein [Xanthomonadales bacterium]